MVTTERRERERERRREGEEEGRGRASPYLVVVIVIKLLVDTLQNSPPTLPPSLGLGYLELKDAIATPLSWDGDPLQGKYNDFRFQILSQYETLRSAYPSRFFKPHRKERSLCIITTIINY